MPPMPPERKEKEVVAHTQTKVMVGGGDWVKYSVHADNPKREWTVREEFSGYGGRCSSYRDIGSYLLKDDAEMAMDRLYKAAIAKSQEGK